MGDWPEAEHCQGSPELNRLHSTMGEQPGLICLWSLSGNPSQGKGDKTWETQMAFCSCQWVSMAHMCPAGGSLAPLLPCSPAPLPRASLSLACICHPRQVNFIQQSC